MPISNALIQATPRNALLGGVSDFLAQSYSPERTQHMQGIAQFLAIPQISRTLDKLSYGELPITGAGGLGGTTRFNNDALDAMMAVAPMVGPGAKAVGQGTMMAGRAGEKLAERVVPQVMQRGGLPAEMLGAMGNRTVSPLDVYHGTPHTLPPTPRNPLGEFDASKIGTGEGAQVYGHGIYTAENPAVAREYANRLGANVITIEGKPMDFNNPVHIAASIISDPNNAGLPGKQLASAIRYDPKGIVPYGAESKVEEIAKALESGNLPKFTNQKGSFYKIDLPDEKVAKMLDWDKPLSQQPPEVQSALKGIETKFPEIPDFNLRKWMDTDPLASTFHNVLQRDLGVEQKVIADTLKERGIPGIKYLDQQSRTPGITSMTPAQIDAKINILKKDINSGLGNQDRMKQILSALEAEKASHLNLTRNFVVFPGEEKSMTILERNGQKFDNSALMK